MNKKELGIELGKLTISTSVGYGVYKNQTGKHQLRNGILAGLATQIALNLVHGAINYRAQKKVQKETAQFINNFNQNIQEQQRMFDEAVRQHQQTVNHHNMLHQQMMNQAMMGM